MKRVSFLTSACCLLLSAISFGIGAQAISTDENPVFTGEITSATVDAFIAAHPPGTIKAITIFSDGGQMLAGIHFGQWVKQNNLDVHVRVMCFSACANYVFTAANKKVIEHGALVMWHGSSREKRFRDMLAYYSYLADKSKSNPSKLTTAEQKYLEDNELMDYNMRVQGRAEDEFFEAIHVDEKITRLGQEPIDYGMDAWAATVEVMSEFGIDHVEADRDYASVEYMKRNHFAAFTLHGNLQTFSLSDTHELIRTSSR